MNPIEILLIEDNPGDIELTRIAMNRSKLYCNLNVVEDGVDGMDFLYQRGRFEYSPRPDLILLDLNLPRKSGREILEEIKSDPNLQDIPVVILTASKADEDILRSYNCHANCFISKPVGFEEFMHVVKTLNDFWFTIVKLPASTKKMPAVLS